MVSVPSARATAANAATAAVQSSGATRAGFPAARPELRFRRPVDRRGEYRHWTPSGNCHRNRRTHVQRRQAVDGQLGIHRSRQMRYPRRPGRETASPPTTASLRPPVQPCHVDGVVGGRLTYRCTVARHTITNSRLMNNWVAGDLGVIKPAIVGRYADTSGRLGPAPLLLWVAARRL